MPLQRRLPKVGFRSRTAHLTAEVMLYRVAALGLAEVDLGALKKAGLVGSEIRRVKVVNKGVIQSPVKVVGLACTAGAKAAIEAAGGSVE